MNKLITHKITLSIFFVIVCQFTAKAQDSTKTVIVVVRPGGATGVTSIATATTVKTPVPAAAIAAIAATIGTAAPASKYSASATGTVLASAGVQKTAAVIPATHKAAVKQYIAPGSRSHTYMAPSTAERTGNASYMNKKFVPAGKTVVAATVTPPVVSGTAKYAASAPVTVTPAAAPAPSKKDTVYVTKIQKDTVPEPPKKHTGNKIVFAEIGGPGLAVSLNYDMRFKKGSKDGFGFRAGVGYFAAGNNTVFTVPLMVNYLYGKDGKYIELGLGTTFLNSKGDNYSSSVWEFDDVTGFIATAVIGVRYEPNKALNFRLGYVPILYDEGLINAGGFSIGYTF